MRFCFQNVDNYMLLIQDGRQLFACVQRPPKVLEPHAVGENVRAALQKSCRNNGTGRPIFEWILIIATSDLVLHRNSDANSHSFRLTLNKFDSLRRRLSKAIDIFKYRQTSLYGSLNRSNVNRPKLISDSPNLV